MSHPKAFGLPCWDAERVEAALSITAQTSEQSRAYFLAAHSPFAKIVAPLRENATMQEEEVFREIFFGAKDVQAFIRGEPGTGKSHLVRWLNLRAEHAASSKELGLDQYHIVLVTRGNGSLKDALIKIVEQLPPKFARHAERLQEAVQNISDATARAKLCDAIALQLDKARADRGEPPLPGRMKHLGQALRQRGFGEWLQRDGGVVAQIIDRLRAASSVEERDAFPEFTLLEFNPTQRHLSRSSNAQEALDLIEDLREDEELAAKACAYLNEARKHAQADLTRLRASDLYQIFRDIRGDLHKQGRQLAVFVEDVSVLGFDQEVVNAFEPRSEAGLCRMVAIIGITDRAWDLLPDNQRQRESYQYEVGGKSMAMWAKDPESVAHFTARYLNAVRLPSNKLESVAKGRFAGDVGASHCAQCPHREVCFQAFGQVELEGGVQIGMFPFNLQAPHSMLQGIEGSGPVEGKYKSQRGLLKLVLMPALGQSAEAFQRREFPPRNAFGLKGRAISSWDTFKDNYLGPGWDDAKVRRLEFLAQHWTSAVDAVGLAAELQALLKPFGFPDFAKAAEKKRIDKKEPGGQKPAPPSEDKRYSSLHDVLEAWKGGKVLKLDKDFRTYLKDLHWNSIRWQDERGVPIKEARELLGTNRPFRIEGQETSSSIGSFFIDFKRGKETGDLLSALLRFNAKGSKGWRYEGGEADKRLISRWIKSHRSQIVDSIAPEEPGLVEGSVACAAKALCIAAMARDRRPVELTAASLARIFSLPWEADARPPAVSEEMQDVLASIGEMHSAFREMLVSEVGIGQGDASPQNFIDPGQILDAIESLGKRLVVEVPERGKLRSYWQSRLEPAAKVDELRQLTEALRAEAAGIAKAVKQIEEMAREAGIQLKGGATGFARLIPEARDLIRLQRKLFPLHDADFDRIWDSGALEADEAVLEAGLAAAKALPPDGGLEVILFDVRPFERVCKDLAVVKRYLERVEREIKAQESAGGAGRKSGMADLLGELSQIAGLGEKSVEAPND